MIYPPTRIADCRDAHSALAALCDGLPVSASAVRLYEAGGSVPGGHAIVELAFVMGVTADWLLGIPPVRQR